LLSASIVICAYTEERWEMLVEAVTSSLTQSHRPLQVILVIDHNTSLFERCRDALGTWQGLGTSEVLILENRLRKGLGGARTTGTEACIGDAVVFLDDDAVGSPTWLEELVRPFADEKVMMTSGWIIPKWMTSRPQWFPDEFLWVVGCSYEGLPPSGAVIRNPIGASMAIRTSIIEQVGMFESRLGRNSADGNGCEETEYAIRAHQLFPDNVVVHAANSVVEHLVPAARTKLRYFFTRCWREGRSKAILVDIAGRGDSLSAERNYVRSTLPRGVVKGLRRVSTWGRSLTIIGGALTTAAGYVVTRLRLTVTGTA
jgi:glycosyltransferase involved in cell wall biosynthesis